MDDICVSLFYLLLFILFAALAFGSILTIIALIAGHFAEIVTWLWCFAEEKLLGRKKPPKMRRQDYSIDQSKPA